MLFAKKINNKYVILLNASMSTNKGQKISAKTY